MRIFIIALLATSALSFGLSDFTKLLKKNDGPLNPKEFNLLVLLPGIKKKLGLKGLRFASIKNSKVHQGDIIAEAVSHHKSTGGNLKNAHVLTNSKDIRRDQYHLLLDFLHTRGNPRPWQFRKNRKKLVSLPYGSLEECIRSNKVGVDFKADPENRDNLLVTFAGKTMTVPVKEFHASGLTEFLTNMCKLVELTKNQVKDSVKNTYLVELGHVKDLLLNQKYSILAKTVLHTSLNHAQNHAKRIFGDSNAHMLAVSYAETAAPSTTSRRVLAESKSEVKRLRAVDQTASAIRYVAMLVMLLIYLLILVAIYRMKVHKESLVYATFITTKKDL